MRWIEWIHLRCQTESERAMAESAFVEVHDELSEEGLVQADMFVNRAFCNDAVVSLYWESVLPENGESQLGATFAAMLKEFGMVYKTSWVSATAKTDGLKHSGNTAG